MNKQLRAAINSDEAIKIAWGNIGISTYRGSLAHGTAGDILDDVDVGGVFIAPIENYIGLTSIEHIDRVCVADKYDFCLYEVRKFFRLLLKSNPNVLSWLWMSENMYLDMTPWGRYIIEHRDIFMSKAMYKSYGGYAFGQLKRMTHPCTDQAFQGKKRRERFEKFGYDCKNAAHLIRLLRMGIEALTTGEIQVARHDAIELKEIKCGNWSLEKVGEEAERLQKLLDESFVRSNLKARPDFKKAEEILVEILREHLN